MKIHSSIPFALCAWIFVVNTISCEFVHFPSDDANNKCIVNNELYWKLIQWFYGPLSYIDVNAIAEPNATQSIMQLTGKFLREISNRKFSIRIYF